MYGWGEYGGRNRQMRTWHSKKMTLSHQQYRKTKMSFAHLSFATPMYGSCYELMHEILDRWKRGGNVTNVVMAATAAAVTELAAATTDTGSKKVCYSCVRCSGKTNNGNWRSMDISISSIAAMTIETPAETDIMSIAATAAVSGWQLKCQQLSPAVTATTTVVAAATIRLRNRNDSIRDSSGDSCRYQAQKQQWQQWKHQWQ